eukprot:m.134850 g.134850  ORF g.134850 m.134850 type:complete len:93 (-) comp14702_c0_seq2:407-685(-)
MLQWKIEKKHVYGDGDLEESELVRSKELYNAHLGGDFSSRINDCTVLYNASKTISFCSGHKMSIFLDASIMLIQLRTKQATTQLELQPGLKC